MRIDVAPMYMPNSLPEEHTLVLCRPDEHAGIGGGGKVYAVLGKCKCSDGSGTSVVRECRVLIPVGTRYCRNIYMNVESKRI